MIINNISYRVFGKLKEYELRLSPGLNIIIGENEAGKSTIFTSIKTFLFGFTPATREKHPYVSWDTGELDFSVEFEVESQKFILNRRLTSSPKATLTNLSSKTVNNFRNEPLSFVKNISEILYGSVFHITAESLSQLESETWESIQERLIFNYGTDYLRRTSELLTELEQEISYLWRRDKRGNPLIAQKESQVRNLLKEKLKLEGKFDEIAKLTLEYEKLNENQHKLERQKKEIENDYKQLQMLLPIKNKFERINFLRSQLKNLSIHNEIDEESYNLYNLLKRDIIELEGEALAFHKEKNLLIAEMIVISEEEKTILDNEENIQNSRACLTKLEQLDEKLQILTIDLAKKRELIQYQHNMIFDSEFKDEYEPFLLSLNPMEIKTELYKYMETSNRVLSSSHSGVVLRDIILLSIGALLLIASIFIPNLRLLGFVASAIIGILASKLIGFKRSPITIHDCDSIKEKLIERFKAINIKLPEYVWQDGSFMFVSKLEQLLSQLFEQKQIVERIQNVKEKMDEQENKIKEMCFFVNEEQFHNIRLCVPMLGIKLDRLKAISAYQDKLGYELKAAESRISSLEEKKKLKNNQLSEIEMKFLNLGMGDLENGFIIYSENNELLKRIRVFEEELSLSQELVDKFNSFEEKSLISPYYLDEISKSILDLNNDIQRNSLAIHDLELDISSLKENFQIEAIESELLLLTDEIEQLYEKRNSLLMTYEIVKYADEIFRRENQPDILQKVSRYMKLMTNGKYNEVLISEKDGSFELQFLTEKGVFPISKAFSKGTVHQLFLAFRLAVIESLNNTGTKLPIVLDEVFVNWDEIRLNSTSEIIEMLSHDRQVILLTCKEYYPRFFKGANVITKIGE